MTQQTLAGFEKYGKTTRRAQFLAEMEQVVPWAQLCALIEPVYPKGGSGEGGQPPDMATEYIGSSAVVAHRAVGGRPIVRRLYNWTIRRPLNRCLSQILG